MGPDLTAGDSCRGPETIVALDEISFYERWKIQIALFWELWCLIWLEIQEQKITN